MHTKLEGGVFHTFTTTIGAHISIWEKEPGIFFTVDGKEPDEYLRNALKELDDGLNHSRGNLKKAKLLKSLLDLQVEGDSFGDAGIKFLQMGEGQGLEEMPNEKLNEMRKLMDDLEGRVQKMGLARIEFLEFMNLCGVQPEGNTSNSEADSLMKKLTGGAPKAEE
jgi:hypothetical protein